jgi:transcriptional regulator with XRE-family HTH domain
MDANAVKLAALIMAKRREEKIGLRAAAQESGVSPSTLSRLERGNLPSLPDTDTLTKLAVWLNVSLDEIFIHDQQKSDAETPKPTTPEIVEAHLRADKNLSSDTAKALADMFKSLYNQVAKSRNQEDG